MMPDWPQWRVRSLPAAKPAALAKFAFVMHKIVARSQANRLALHPLKQLKD